MAAGFTKPLSERLNLSSRISVREAADGDHVEGGTALMAPGGSHMDLTGSGEIALRTVSK
jgi:two-component system chemotaxis response regulator CheB